MPRISEASVLIVATDGFEEWELFGPKQILEQSGADVKLAAPKAEPIQATVHDDPGKTIRPDMIVGDAKAEDFDALVLPGGLRNPDHLRTNVRVIELVREFAALGKPVAAICHGPWLLVEADVLRGRKATGWPSIRTDLRNAGAIVEDAPVVIDGNIITSRKPEDVEAFAAAVIAQIDAAEATETRQASAAARLTFVQPFAAIRRPQ